MSRQDPQPVVRLGKCLLESTPCHVPTLTKTTIYTNTAPTTSGRRSGSTGQPWRKSTGRGAGLAWVGRHPERETDETIAGKGKPPQRLKEVLTKMAWPAGIAKHA